MNTPKKWKKIVHIVHASIGGHKPLLLFLARLLLLIAMICRTNLVEKIEMTLKKACAIIAPIPSGHWGLHNHSAEVLQRMHPRTDELYDFVAIGELADTMKQLIYMGLAYNIRRQDQVESLARVEQIILQQARDYLGRVREGFVLSVRTTDVSSGDELGYLLERVLLDWDTLSRELELAPGADATQDSGAHEQDAHEQIERVRDQLLAFGMAAVAMGMLPRLPNSEITFPKSYRKPPTYADIPVPNTPAQMLQRIEEIEQMIWQINTHDLVDLVERRYDPLRRTYGFFESSAWLAHLESRRFGVKGGQNRLL